MRRSFSHGVYCSCGNIRVDHQADHQQDLSSLVTGSPAPRTAPPTQEAPVSEGRMEEGPPERESRRRGREERKQDRGVQGRTGWV